MEDKPEGDIGDTRGRNHSPAMFGTSLTLGSAMLVLVGYWLDRRAGGGYSRTIAGLVLAMIYIAYEVWKLNRSLTNADRQTPRPPGENPGGSP
jgi:4-hydroxybenzoate polyprenyltransferase